MRFAVLLALALVALVSVAKLSKIHAHRSETEAKRNLRTALTTAVAHQASSGAASTDIATLGLVLERGNRYTYFLDDPVVLHTRTAASEVWHRGPNAIGTDEFKWRVRAVPSYGAALCPLSEKTTAGGKLRLGANGTSGAPFLFAAAGNLDSDPDLDCWSIADVDRVTAGGIIAPAGAPLHEQADRPGPSTLERIWTTLESL